MSNGSLTIDSKSALILSCSCSRFFCRLVLYLLADLPSPSRAFLAPSIAGVNAHVANFTAAQATTSAPPLAISPGSTLEINGLAAAVSPDIVALAPDTLDPSPAITSSATLPTVLPTTSCTAPPTAPLTDVPEGVLAAD